MELKPEIFFSYAWGDAKEQGESREKIINDLYDSLLKDNYPVIRDKYDLGYKGIISEFMEKIGEGKYIVVAISEKYIRSPYCMFELYEIARNSNFNKHRFAEKVLPIMVEFIDFTKPKIIEGHLEYWEREFNEWAELLKKRGNQLSIEKMQRYDKIRQIYQNVDKLTEWIIDINSLNPQMLSKDNFAEIKKAIGARISFARMDEKSGTAIISSVKQPVTKKEVEKFLGVPPFITETFLGREEDLKSIHHQLFEGNNLLLLVNGEGGIGKTTLAAQYYRRYENEYQHLAWVFTGNSFRDALLSLAPNLDISFHETMPGEERIQKLFEELRVLKSPSLLIIDNANEIKDLEDHYIALRSCTNFHLLLTTRITEFEQAATYKIEPLEKRTAVELFKKHYPRHLESENILLEKLLDAVGYNTLLIELLAKNLLSFNQFRTNYSLAQLLHDLQEKGLLALNNTKLVHTNYQARGTALRKETLESIVEAMYELSQLNEQELVLLSVFAVLPAESIAFDLLETLIPGTENLDETFVGLSQKGWLNREDNNNSASFKISPVIQEITKKKNEQLLRDCKSLYLNLAKKLTYQPGTGHLVNSSYEEAALYARYAGAEISNFKPDEDIALLHEKVANYYQVTGNLDKALEFYQQYNRLEKELYAAQPSNINFKDNLAISYQYLGTAHDSLGNLDQALSCYEDFNRLEKELYEDYPANLVFKNGLAISYQYLGTTQDTLGNTAKALEFYEDYNRLKKELYENDPSNVGFKNGLAISYQHLGKAQVALGNPTKALEFYEDYNRLKKELYQEYPANLSFKNGLAISYQYLGKAQMLLGNLEKALEFYESYNRLEKELSKDYPSNVDFKDGLAISNQYLGTTQVALGNPARALEFFEEYNRLTKELYQDYPSNVDFKNGLAISYQYLGLENEKSQNNEKAINYYEVSKQLLSELIISSPNYAEFKKNFLWVEKRLSIIQQNQSG